MHFDYKLFSLSIKKQRNHSFLTQKEAAKSIGLHVSTFARFEHEGRRAPNGDQLMPNIDRFFKVCKWLNMPMESFFTSK